MCSRITWSQTMAIPSPLFLVVLPTLLAQAPALLVLILLGGRDVLVVDRRRQLTLEDDRHVVLEIANRRSLSAGPARGCTFPAGSGQAGEREAERAGEGPADQRGPPGDVEHQHRRQADDERA